MILLACRIHLAEWTGTFTGFFQALPRRQLPGRSRVVRVRRPRRRELDQQKAVPRRAADEGGELENDYISIKVLADTLLYLTPREGQ